MNLDERAAYAWLRAKGLTVLRRGWPDFLVQGRGGWFALELKAPTRRRLTGEQLRMHRALREAGLETATILWHAGEPRALLHVEQHGRQIDIYDPAIILRRGQKMCQSAAVQTGSVEDAQ
jgi:hypothetical protein